MPELTRSAAQKVRRTPWYALAVTSVTLATFLVSLLWAFSLPHFEGPDENRHFNSVIRLLEGGGWPLPYDANVADSTWQAYGEAGWPLPDDEYLEPIVEPSERADLLDESTLPSRSRDQMVQHPPGFYVVGAALLAAAGGDELRWDHASFLLRGLSALFFAAAVAFSAGVVRWATGSRWAGTIGAFFPLLIPWYTASAGRISNDSLLVAAISATIYALVRAFRDPRSATWMLAFAGVAYGVALGTKGYALLLAPIVVLLMIGVTLRAKWGVWAGAWRLAIPAFTAFSIGGWWWLRNIILLGQLQPSQLGSRERQLVAADGYSLFSFLETFFTRLNATFWGRVGYTSNADPGWGIASAGILLVVVVLSAVALTRSRGLLSVLLLYPIIIAVTIFQNAHGIYWDIGDPTRGTQGRYLYSAISVFVLAFATLIYRFTESRSVPVKVLSTAILGGSSVAVLVASMSWVIPLSWRWHEGRTPARLGDPAAFMDVAPGVYVALIVATLALLLAGVVAGSFVSAGERGSHQVVDHSGRERRLSH